MRLLRTLCALLFACQIAACGDGVDERYDSQGNRIEQPNAGTSPVVLASPILHHFDTLIEDTRATYSGGSTLIKLDGEWLAAGFDNESDPEQPERGALWRSTDLETWERTGLEISDGNYQQVIVELMEIDGTLLAFGVDFGRSFYADVVVWRSTDNGETFRRVQIDRNGGLTQAFEHDGSLWAVGEVAIDDVMVGQIWKSDDLGETWTALDPGAPTASAADPVPVGPLNRVVFSGDTLVAIGSTQATDPAGRGGDISPEEWYGTDPLPIDVGVWSSDDGGTTWQMFEPAGFAGEPDSQYPADAVIVDDRLVIIGGRSIAEAADRYAPTIWTCDLDFTRCEPHMPLDKSFDFASGSLAIADGVVVFAVRAANFDDGTQGGGVGFFDPIGNESFTTSLGSRIEQIEDIYVDEGTIYFIGRDPRTNLMHVASTVFPG